MDEDDDLDEDERDPDQRRASESPSPSLSPPLRSALIFALSPLPLFYYLSLPL